MKEWWLSKEKNDIFATNYSNLNYLAQFVHEYLHSYKENFLHTNFFKKVHPINSQKPCNNIAKTFECSKNRKKIWIFFCSIKIEKKNFVTFSLWDKQLFALFVSRFWSTAHLYFLLPDLFGWKRRNNLWNVARKCILCCNPFSFHVEYEKDCVTT